MPTFIAHDLILKHWVINVKLSTFLTNFPIYKSACNKRMYQPNTKKCHVDQLIDSSKLKYIAIC